MKNNLQSVKRTEESVNHSEDITFCILEGDREKWMQKKRVFWKQ